MQHLTLVPDMFCCLYGLTFTLRLSMTDEGAGCSQTRLNLAVELPGFRGRLVGLWRSRHGVELPFPLLLELTGNSRERQQQHC